VDASTSTGAWLHEAPGWFAHFAVWACPREHPSPQVVDDATLALAELWVGRALCAILAQEEEVPFPVEAALRATASESLDVGGWLSVLEALLDADHATDPEALAAGVPELASALGCAPTLTGLLSAAGGGELPRGYVDALGAWLAQAGVIHRSPLCWVRAVHRQEGKAHVELRRFVGTAHPALTTVVLDHAPPLPEGQLVFWDGDGAALPVPRWLAYWDPATRQVRWYNGRNPDGRVRYRGWWGPVATRRMPDDAPVFLADDVRHTPNPSSAHTPLPSLPSILPGPTPPGAERHRETQPMAQPRVSVPPAADAIPHPFAPEDPLVLRVLTTRYVLRYVRLSPGADVTIGRNSDHSSFVLAHHQLSRAHTRVRHRDGVVWVNDMGSTNGTQLNGHDVGREEVPAAPGDIVSAGPVLLRIEHLPEDQLARMEVVTGLRPAADRDALTRLLLPKHLVEHLPPTLQASFQDGGPDGDGPSLWGIVLRIDRLHAMHAQLGQAVADAAFAITARLVQGHVPQPLAVARIGYGELLVPLVGSEEDEVRATAAELMRLVREQPWEDPLTKVTLTAGIGEKRSDESAGVWVARIRAGLPSPGQDHSSPESSD